MKESLFDIRCEWGEQGVLALREVCEVLVIVDVLSFSTCVSIACNKGAKVLPASSYDQAAKLAQEQGAHLAVSREQWQKQPDQFCLSPQSMLNAQPGQAIVLPSPNGSRLSMLAGDMPVVVGCLRNARAAAVAAMHLGSSIGVIPAGERWPDDSLRVAWEDLIGAGAVINELDGERSPEAAVAEMAYLGVVGEVEQRMHKTVSGRELAEKDFADDLILACEDNVDNLAPRLLSGVYSAG